MSTLNEYSKINSIRSRPLLHHYSDDDDDVIIVPSKH